MSKDNKKGNMAVPQSWTGQERRFGETLKSNVDLKCLAKSTDLPCPRLRDGHNSFLVVFRHLFPPRSHRHTLD